MNDERVSIMLNHEEVQEVAKLIGDAAIRIDKLLLDMEAAKIVPSYMLDKSRNNRLMLANLAKRIQTEYEDQVQLLKKN